ncbi:MAG: phosphoribosyl-AMP cyclohydrolase [Actinomycetota bacterium]
MSSEIEEGTALTLDFSKLESVAATGQAVIPVVLQHADNGDVLFVGYANELALRATLDEGAAVLWSTSRNELWRKGATSGDVLKLVDVRINCEQNSVLYRVRPVGDGVCHTKGSNARARPTCYYRTITGSDEVEFLEGLR